MNNNYQKEIKNKYGETDAYNEYEKKTINYSKIKWDEVNTGLMNIMSEFSSFLKSGVSNESEEALILVQKLQNYISNNYYKCTNQILLSLGNMYENDERFKENIDKEVKGTAHYINQAIKNYLLKGTI